MLISDKKKIMEVQREFNARFPYLKIEFYKKEHDTGEGSPARLQLDQRKTLGKVRTVHDEADFEIQPDMKVSELEKTFHDRFGLNAQVFRKSGNLWIQTTSTDDWTLEMQNRKGGSSELAYKEKYNH